MAARATAMPSGSFMTFFLLFSLGSMLAHSANCVYNDICDMKYDGLVERTKNRPLPSGVVSVPGAAVFGFTLLLPVFCLLNLCNRTAMIIGLVGILPIHGLYPLMKRWTWWPQAWLGLSFNWGVVVGWAAVTGDIAPVPIWVLAAGGICWTIYYDTIYACQDRDDDRRVGVKSTAVLFGDSVRSILACFALAFIVCLGYSGYKLDCGVGYYVLSCGATSAHLLWQLITWDDGDLKDHRAKFESNGVLAFIIWAGMFYDYLCAAPMAHG